MLLNLFNNCIFNFLLLTDDPVQDNNTKMLMNIGHVLKSGIHQSLNYIYFKYILFY